ncbi:MAG: LacI family transcriptional regulator [Paludibacteraceae bacterium]|nr:LacI family transcriptional regulator [Paludibacteraceae bacterium]
MSTITIKDIARELGYSISTVSRALQNHPDISDETKRVVVTYAREHHYRPNQLASSLRTQKNTTIGVLLPDLTNWFFSTILAGAEKAANEAGYNILIARTNEEPERELQCLQMLCNSRVAGIIACPTKLTTDFAAYDDVLDSGIPLVLVDRRSPVTCDQIISDDYHGAFQAVEYLIQTGCKHIAMFSSVLVTPPVSERERGYREALEHYGLTVHDGAVVRCASREEAIHNASAILGTSNSPDAIFCTSDNMADGVVYVAKMKRVRVPDQLSVCGFSNDKLTVHTDPMQTTVEQYGRRIGRLAVEALLGRLEGDQQEASPRLTVVPSDLIVRETTR